MHDRGDAIQGRVFNIEDADDCIEGTAIAHVAEFGALDVIWNVASLIGDSSDLVCWHVNKLRIGIDEPGDQPWTSNSIDFGRSGTIQRIEVCGKFQCGPLFPWFAANDWVFDRRSDSEMAAEAPGKWCDYGLYFSWSHEISAMHFTCAFDLKVPEKRRAALYELLGLANERLWIGHFGMDSEDGMPVFRHSVLLRGAPGASAESLEDMIDIAVTIERLGAKSGVLEKISLTQ